MVHIVILLAVLAVAVGVVLHFGSKAITAVKADVKADVAKVETDIAADIKKL